jgi:vacuolar-type H+-ATPase subunit I/STV1
VDKELQDIILIDWIAIGVSIGFIVIAFGCFLLFTNKYRGSEEKTKIQLAFLIFFLCMGIARIIIIYFDYGLTHLDPLEFINHQLVWKIESIFQLGGIGCIIYASENGVFKGRDVYGFLIGYIILVCIGLLHPDLIMAQTFTVIAMIFALFIPISYIYLAYKYPAVRKDIFYLFVGFAIFGLGIKRMYFA